MRQDVFRQENLDAAKSPESTDDFVRAARIPRWLIVVALVALIAAWVLKFLLLS